MPTIGKEELIDSIKTPKGELQLTKQVEGDYARQVSVKLSGKVLLKTPYQTVGFREIAGENAQTVFLVFLGTDSLACIGKFVVVDLSPMAKVTEEFGNCSDAPCLPRPNFEIDFPGWN